MRPALTLLELVVVLGILAVLSTVAVRSLEPIADQARYEQTQSLLTQLQMAIVTPLGSGTGNTTVAQSSYLIDTGSLPTTLEDLLVRPASIVQRSLQSFDSDRDSIVDVQLVSGWNGPYYSAGPGHTEILDGWGAAPELIGDSGSLAILSRGSDGDSVAPEDGYRQDVSVTTSPQDTQGNIVFRLFSIDGMSGSRIDPAPIGTQRLGVLFYGVNSTGGTGGQIAEQLIIIPSPGSFEFRRESTLIGITAARAILWDDINSDQILDPGELIISKSIVHYPVVHPSVDTRVELELR